MRRARASKKGLPQSEYERAWYKKRTRGYMLRDRQGKCRCKDTIGEHNTEA